VSLYKTERSFFFSKLGFCSVAPGNHDFCFGRNLLENQEICFLMLSRRLVFKRSPETWFDYSQQENYSGTTAAHFICPLRFKADVLAANSPCQEIKKIFRRQKSPHRRGNRRVHYLRRAFVPDISSISNCFIRIRSRTSSGSGKRVPVLFCSTTNKAPPPVMVMCAGSFLQRAV